jgi:hypothetical protein
MDLSRALDVQIHLTQLYFAKSDFLSFGFIYAGATPALQPHQKIALTFSDYEIFTKRTSCDYPRQFYFTIFCNLLWQKLRTLFTLGLGLPLYSASKLSFGGIAPRRLSAAVNCSSQPLNRALF